MAAREKKKLAKKGKNKVSEIKTLMNEVASLKRSIAKAEIAEMNEGDDDPVTPTDAGAQFGGRNKKAKK